MHSHRTLERHLKAAAASALHSSDDVERSAVGLFAALSLRGDAVRDAPQTVATAEALVRFVEDRAGDASPADFEALHAAALALFQVGGGAWARGGAALRGAFEVAPRRDGLLIAPETAIRRWGARGASVATTAYAVRTGTAALRVPRFR